MGTETFWSAEPPPVLVPAGVRQASGTADRPSMTARSERMHPPREFELQREREASSDIHRRAIRGNHPKDSDGRLSGHLGPVFGARRRKSRGRVNGGQPPP